MAIPKVVQSKLDSSIGNGLALTTWKTSFQNGTQAGNCIVVVIIYGSSTVANYTIADDKSNTYVAGSHANDGGNNQSIEIRYALNVAAGTKKITVTLGGALNYVDVYMFELMNVATASATDTAGSSAVVGAGTSIAAGSFTTAVDGDFVFQAWMIDGFSAPTEPITFTKGSGFTLMLADGCNFKGLQYQIQTTHGAINPTVTSSLSFTSAITCAMAFKSASSGSDLPAGIADRSHQVQDLLNNNSFTNINAGTVFKIQAPSTGNLLAFWWMGQNAHRPISITDNNSNTWIQTVWVVGGAGEDIQCWRAENANSSGDLILTISLLATPQTNAVLALLDISGADANSPLDVTSTATGNETVLTSGTIVGCVITPTTANGLIIKHIQEQSESVVAVTPGQYTGIDTDVYQAFESNQDGGYGIEYNADTSQRTDHWTYSAKEAGTPVIGFWWTAAVAFKKASGVFIPGTFVTVRHPR